MVLFLLFCRPSCSLSELQSPVSDVEEYPTGKIAGKGGCGTSDGDSHPDRCSPGTGRIPEGHFSIILDTDHLIHGDYSTHIFSHKPKNIFNGFLRKVVGLRRLLQGTLLFFGFQYDTPDLFWRV